MSGPKSEIPKVWSKPTREGRRELKRKEAEERQEIHNKLSIEEKIAKLDDRFGKGIGAKKERLKLQRAIEERIKKAEQAKKEAETEKEEPAEKKDKPKRAKSKKKRDAPATS